MAVASDQVNAVLVEYLDKQAWRSWGRNHAFLDSALEIVEASGSGVRIPIQTPSGSGIGADFQVALNNAPSSGFTAVGFTPTPAIEYGNAVIQWAEAALASDKRTSPLDIPMTATKNASLGAMEAMANTLIGGSTVEGAWARITTATLVTGTIYDLLLEQVTDAAKFSQGTELVSKLNAAAALDAGTGEVLGVSPQAGVIRVDGGGSWTPTANHYIAPRSLMIAGTSRVGLFPSVFTWIPPYANRTNGAPGDTLYGVVRDLTSNVPYVAGFGFQVSGPIWQGVYASVATMINVSKDADPNIVLCNPLVLPTLAQSAQAQIVRFPGKKNAEFGFQGFEVIGPKSPMKVMADPSIPLNYITVTKENSWVLFKPTGGSLLQPATNNKVIIDDYGAGTGLNQSRASVMCVAAGFGCREPVSQAVLTIANPSVLVG